MTEMKQATYYELDKHYKFVWASGHRPALFQIHEARSADDPLVKEMVAKANRYEDLAEVARKILAKLDSPDLSVTALDADELRAALGKS